YYEGTYYMYPSNAGDYRDDTGIKVYTSTDLVHWTDRGWALHYTDIGTIHDLNGNEVNYGTSAWNKNYNFWAPGVIEHNGKFYMYYSCMERVCLAVADSPLGPFVQNEETGYGEFIQANEAPPGSNGMNIDAHIFKDDDGQLYYYAVFFTGGNDIWGCKLGDDMKTIDTSSWTKLLHSNQGWDQDMGNINEGPFMVKYDGKYYLTYSGSNFISPKYGIGYAVADSPLGKFAGQGASAENKSFDKYAMNPVMQANELVPGAGHHCVAKSPDGKEYYVVYHRHNGAEDKVDTGGGLQDPRSMCIDEMKFVKNENGETVIEIDGPTVTEQDGPSGAIDADNLIDIYRVVDNKKEALPKEVPAVTVPWGTSVTNTGITSSVAGVTLVTSKEKSKTYEDENYLNKKFDYNASNKNNSIREMDQRHIVQSIDHYWPISESQEKDYQGLSLKINWDFSKVNFKPDKTTTYDIEGTLVLPTVEKAYGQVQNLGNKDLKVTSKITVSGKTHSTVTYNLNGGKNNAKNASTFTGKLTLANPTKAGYIFAGWYKDAAFKTKVTTLSGTADFTVYAKWTKVSVGKPVIKSAKNAKGKKVTVTLKAKVKNVAGYTVNLATDKKFKKDIKKAKIAANKTSVTVKGLKKGKTYFVRVQAYAKDSTGKTINGSFSKVAKVKVTK
nr:family 43 glycosylhydrolase [Lachnospiraceae bacterium]